MIIKIQIRINSDSQQLYIIFTYNILVSYLRMVNIPRPPEKNPTKYFQNRPFLNETGITIGCLDFFNN